MTGVPIERRFALLVSFVGDIAQELATAEGCRRNPEAGIASRRRETVDRALQVFSSASRDVIGQRFPGTTGTMFCHGGHRRPLASLENFRQLLTCRFTAARNAELTL